MYPKSTIETQDQSNNKKTRHLSSVFFLTLTVLHTFFIVCNLSNLSLYLFSINKTATLLSNSRSSRSEVFCKKGVIRNFAKFIGKYLRQSLFCNKVAPLRPATILKKRLWDRCFPVNFAKFLRTPFSQSTSGGCFCNSHYAILQASFTCWKLTTEAPKQGAKYVQS